MGNLRFSQRSSEDATAGILRLKCLTAMIGSAQNYVHSA